MKIKKAFPIVLAVLMVGGLVAGCKPNTPENQHTQHNYVYTKIDENNHKKTCDGCNEVNETEAHVYDGDTDKTCNFCSYERQVAAEPANPSQGDTTPKEDTSTKFTGKIYLVGDSTVCKFNDEYYIPRYGYGTQIHNYINMDEANVVNLALSGRSSWSYTYDVSQDKNNEYNDTGTSYYQHLTSSLSQGDYLIIGFGHNDEKREVKRYTDPTLNSTDATTTIGSYNANRAVSFKYVLKHYYIDVAKEKGATPILCTPITRLFEDAKKTSYDTVHVTDTKSANDANSGVNTTWNGGDYAKAIKDLAAEEQLLCVDLTTITKTEYKQIGYNEAVKYHAATGAEWTDDTKTAKKPTGTDETHTNLYGAKMNAYHIASAVKTSNLGLAANVKTNIAKPTYEENKTAIINVGYNIPDKEAFKPEDKSSFWTGIDGVTTDTANAQAQYKWYATAFGASAKANSEYFTITQGTDADGLTFTLKAEAGKGKIDSKGDSIAAVFIQVPFKTAFNVAATAKVKTFSGEQSAFGLMVRDDIYIDVNDKVTSNYVTAGCRGTSSDAIMGFARNGGTLQNSSNKASYPAANSTFALSLARTSQSITANTGTYSYSAVSDFDLAVSDSEYVYVCLWVTRGTEVIFSNISFTSSEWEAA